MSNAKEDNISESGASRVSEAAVAYGPRVKKNRAETIPGTSIPRYMSEDEYVEWYQKVDREVRADWVAGEVILLMGDNLEHHEIEFMIMQVLRQYIRLKQLGRAFHSRIQIRLPMKPSRREPDILFVAKGRESILRKALVDGPPDLAMEIVSPSSETRDYRTKFLEYEEAGVQEYWLIDPILKTMTVYALNANGRYEKILGIDGKFESKVVPGFYLRQHWIDHPESVDLFDVLKEMGIH